MTAELPGVDENDLDVTLVNGMLTVRGEKRTERDEQDKDKNWHVVERSYGSFGRAIPCRSIQIQRKSRRSLIRAYSNQIAKAGGGGEEAAKDRDQESLKYDNTRPLVRSNWSKPGRFADDMRTAPTEPLE